MAAVWVVAGLGGVGCNGIVLGAGTLEGEIQSRPAPVYRCPGLPCTQPNVFNLSVAVHFNASAAQLTAIRDLLSAGSAILFDATDGQAEIGEAFIYNNAFGAVADLHINPASSPTWWYADTGQWQVGGGIHVSIDNVMAAGAPGESLAHEFVHLVFDARDEYESRAAGCGGVIGGASCPDAAAIAAGAASCLMDQGGVGAVDGAHSELCWGHGDPANLLDLSGGNHDATTETEHSRCRSNRSCWEQVLWSWPDHFTLPAGAPDPAAGGAVVDPTHFVTADDTMRVVLVLDESGSMSLESPTRMQRLQVAANDFVTLAETGTELGIVSFSDDAEPGSGHANVAIAPLGAVRVVWTTAINSLTPGEWTNIGDGLQKARAMIHTAGGVTANTCILLMTDGLNNRPDDDPAGHLSQALDDLLADGIPVYVTCTGGDLGLSSQCSEIAAATGGFYVDSADAADLPQTFADFYEKIAGRESIDSVRGTLLASSTKKVFVEEGSESVAFTLVWGDEKAAATLVLIDPQGGQHESAAMPQGRYARVPKPVPGEWQMIITPRSPSASSYLARAYSRSAIQSLTAAVRKPRVLPGKEIHVYAYPRSIGGGITEPGTKILGTVRLPNGDEDRIELNDEGPDASGGGDGLKNDGIFTGVYLGTKQKGPYRFHLQADISKWMQSTDRSKVDEKLRSPRFVREVRVSAAVGEPSDTQPLAIVRVTGCTLTAANVTFSVPVTEKTAGDASNYNIKGLDIVAAKVQSPTRVQLLTSKQSPRLLYTLVARDLVDAATGQVIQPPGDTHTFLPDEDCVTLRFSKMMNNGDGTLTIEWTGGGTLQMAPHVTGPWQDAPKATSPFRFKPTAYQQFGRLRP